MRREKSAECANVVPDDGRPGEPVTGPTGREAPSVPQGACASRDRVGYPTRDEASWFSRLTSVRRAGVTHTTSPSNASRQRRPGRQVLAP